MRNSLKGMLALAILLLLAFLTESWVVLAIILVMIPIALATVRAFLAEHRQRLAPQTANTSTSKPKGLTPQPKRPQRPPRVRLAYFGWIVALALLLVVAEMSRSWVVSWLFYLTTVLVLLSFFLTRKPARLLSVSRHLSASHAEMGQPVTVQVALEWERLRFPGWMLVQDSLPSTFSALSPCGRLFTTGHDAATTYTYQVSGGQRGYHRVGPLTMSRGDLFGLDQVTSAGEDSSYLTIYPRLFAIPPLRIPSNRPIGEARSTKRIYEDATRIVGVRDYLPGDSLSKIHWKASAHSGSLATKLCEPSSSVEVHMILNLAAADYPPEGDEVELACTTAASISAGLLLDKQIVGLQSNGADNMAILNRTFAAPLVKPGKGTQQFSAIMSLLGRLQTADEPGLAEYLTLVHSSLPWTATILVITHILSEEGAVALEGLQRSGFEVAVAIVGAGELAELSAARAAATGLTLANIPAEQHLGTLEFWQPGRA